MENHLLAWFENYPSFGIEKNKKNTGKSNFQFWILSDFVGFRRNSTEKRLAPILGNKYLVGVLRRCRSAVWPPLAPPDWDLDVYGNWVVFDSFQVEESRCLWNLCFFRPFPGRNTWTDACEHLRCLTVSQSNKKQRFAINLIFWLFSICLVV